MIAAFALFAARSSEAVSLRKFAVQNATEGPPKMEYEGYEEEGLLTENLLAPAHGAGCGCGVHDWNSGIVSSFDMCEFC